MSLQFPLAWKCNFLPIKSVLSVITYHRHHHPLSVVFHAFHASTHVGRYAQNPKEKIREAVGSMGQGQIEDKTVTIVFGSELTAVSYVNFTCNSKQVAQVSGLFLPGQHPPLSLISAHPRVLCAAVDGWSTKDGVQSAVSEWQLGHFPAKGTREDTPPEAARREDSHQKVSDVTNKSHSLTRSKA